MQIVLTRRGSQTNTQEYMRVVFAHISHMIWIESIQVGQSPHSLFGEQVVLIKCKPQGSIEENEALAQVVADAVKLRGDLTLSKISITPTYQIEAIKQQAPNVYEVDRSFAEYVAKNDKYCDELKSINVKKVMIEYVKVGTNTMATTGKIGTQSQGNSPVQFNPSNVYHCFAAAISNDSKLKEKLKNPEGIQEINMMLLGTEVSIDIVSVSSYKISLAKPAPAAVSVADLTKTFGVFDPFANDFQNTSSPTFSLSSTKH